MAKYDFMKDGRAEDDKVEISEFMNAIQVFNGISMIYSLAFFLMLACFSAQMHYQVMDNVTTNE